MDLKIDMVFSLGSRLRVFCSVLDNRPVGVSLGVKTKAEPSSDLKFDFCLGESLVGTDPQAYKLPVAELRRIDG